MPSSGCLGPEYPGWHSQRLVGRLPGFNWYPTYHLKVMFNGILARLEGVKPIGILQMRLQVAF